MLKLKTKHDLITTSLLFLFPHIPRTVKMPPSSKPVALVVGASRGIGRQIAVDLAKADYAGTISLMSSLPPFTELT